MRWRRFSSWRCYAGGGSRSSEIVQGPVTEQGYPEWTGFSSTRVRMNERYVRKGREVSQLVAPQSTMRAEPGERVDQLPSLRIMALPFRDDLA